MVPQKPYSENIKMELLTFDQFKRTATKDQMQLLQTIAECGEREERASREINRTGEAARHGGGVLSVQQGLALTLCEDADDLRAVCGREYSKLDRIRQEMKGYFERAVKLGMGNVGMIARHYEHYVGKPLPQPAH